jgi:hypothetical protein
LRKLRDLKILELTDVEYIPGIKAPQYGFTSRMLHALFPPAQMPKYDLTTEYKTGETHERMLTDIQRLYIAGLSRQDVVEIIKTKDSFRPKEKQRRENTIVSLVANWFRKARSTAPPIPYFNKDYILNLIRRKQVKHE